MISPRPCVNDRTDCILYLWLLTSLDGQFWFQTRSGFFKMEWFHVLDQGLLVPSNLTEVVTCYFMMRLISFTSLSLSWAILPMKMELQPMATRRSNRLKVVLKLQNTSEWKQTDRLINLNFKSFFFNNNNNNIISQCA